MKAVRRLPALAGVALSLLLLSACGGDENPTPAAGGGGGGGGGGSGTPTTGRTFNIAPGTGATEQMMEAMIQAAPGDVIQFACGYFELSSALQLINTEDVKVRGCGIDKTVLSFKTSPTPEGILAVNVGGLVVENLTVLDTGGNGIELRSVNHATLRKVRALWSSGGGRESETPITAENAFANDSALLKVPCTDPPTLNPEAPENMGGDTSSPDYTVSPASGRYGIYPVSSENILIEEAESVGASDAGIYVGQTNNAIIKNSRAAYNVFGFEIENVRGGEYDGNTAECNTGGFLIYDLDNLRQYGDRSRMFKNVSRNNNTYNFTSGGFVGNVPPGSGMITLSYDRIDIFDNEFRDNNTGGIIHASYELFPDGDRPAERRIDWYSEGVHIFRNKFFNNGNGLPAPNSNDISNQDVARFLPALVGLKNVAACSQPANIAQCLTLSSPYRGAHIVWDGLLDERDAECEYPKTASGTNVPADERGKPLLTNQHPDYPCHYNQYKFASTDPYPRKVPEWFASCIDTREGYANEFSSDSLAFSNFHGTRGLEAVIEGDPADPTSFLTAFDPAALADFAASFDRSAHDCVLPELPPVVIPPFVRSGTYDPRPSEATVKALCEAPVASGQVNFGAIAANCPRLEQWNLFADPEDPASAPNGGGVPFVLNSKLFSDYAVKYRVAYLPPGTQAVYHASGGTNENTTITFPTGTIIAKTFSFRNKAEGTEIPKETRLLIKRATLAGGVRWDGLPYIWELENGHRVAKLRMIGATTTASWNLNDADSGLPHSGSTDGYLIPNANQCLSCHSNSDKEPGSSPIGTKVRFLNRKYRSESDTVTGQSQHAVAGAANQLQYWCSGPSPLMTACPEDFDVNADGVATNLERSAVFNKPGSSGLSGNADIEARARAWLEVNCAHCHNERGFAASTGLFLDALRPVDVKYGICKQPTATGQDGNGGRTYDLHPTDVADSILAYRIGPTATTPAARMPPLARSTVDDEGRALIEQWIGSVLVKNNAQYPNSESCE